MSAAVMVRPGFQDIDEQGVDDQWTDILPISEIFPWQEAVFESMRRLNNLPANWDGYGSCPIQYRASYGVGKLLKILSAHDLPIPHVSPVSGGGVQIEWEIEGRALELEILPTGELEYLAVASTGEMGEDRLSNWAMQLPQLAYWLMAGK